LIIKLILLLFISLPIYSQNLSGLANLSIKDGLPSNVVKDIVQDNQGFIWFATQDGLSKYDGYNLESIKLDLSDQFSDVTSLLVTAEDSIWIGTNNKGLFLNKYGNVIPVSLNQSSNPKSIKIRSITQGIDDRIWVGTSAGLFRIDVDTNKVIEIDDFIDENIVSISAINNQALMIATIDRIYQYNYKTKQEIQIRTETPNKNRVVYTDQNHNIWLGKDLGLFKFNYECNCFSLFDEKFKNTKIHSLVANQNHLWIGSLYDGLYNYSFQTKTIQHYQYNERNRNGKLSDTNIVSLFIDRNESLWIGTFRGGINYFNLSSLNFGLINYDSKLMHCAISMVTYDLYEQNKVLWVATEKGLLKLNYETDSCELFQLNKNIHDSFRSILIDSKDRFWVAASKMLYKFNPSNGTFIATNTQSLASSIFFIIEYESNRLLLGSVNGLYAYDISEDSITKITSIDSKDTNIAFNNYAINHLGQYIFASNNGLFELTNDFKLKQLIYDSDIQKHSLITSVFADEYGGIWFGADSKHLLYLTADGVIENRTNLFINEDIQIQDIISNDKELWISSNKGIFRFHQESQQSTKYDINDGLQDDEFLFSSNFKSPSGKIYFGGKSGFNAFFPSQIPEKTQPPNSVISQIQLNGQQLNVGDRTHAGFLLEKNINDLDTIIFNYKDNKINIEFSSLDYSDTTQNKYAYRLLGFNDNWELTSATNRHATYTNLKPGKYTFELKSANKYGQWSSDIKSLSLNILPAPWFSIWAYILYFVMTILSVWGFVHYKAISAEKKAKKLEAIIVSRTNELNSQKKKVESLLQQKNEIFANVTHEFKTPLTLITGPLEQLAQEIDRPKHIQMIQMVQRNAQRLMLMVSQILKLSEVELNKNSARESQAVQPILTMLFEAFNPIAESKGINLFIDNNVDVNIYATPECLEIVIGNLVSNALKFTTIGGEIKIVSQLEDNHICISIKDTGTGIDKQDLDKIFTRFVRLEAHKNIQGTGIGLSVVKEITIANGGSILVNSEWGEGSTFKLTFPITTIDSEFERSNLIVQQIAQNTQAELKSEYRNNNLALKSSKSKITILIIEDNIDMQAHIDNVLSQRFKCLFASRGKTGIALALKQVPDIIISDVMMPGLDGYKVTRILRNDSRTSHIPIVLLTALNTKESRIKGWRENIDIYIAKPFDAIELNAQLDNILIIRKILQQQTNKLINTNGSLSSLNLSEQDLKFIEKLKEVISKNYTNNHFQKADLASKMAISERLLHRKVTALIDENPLNMLRNYRLQKAALSLKKGYQVSQVSDECGFNSVPYFCRCFRENYGISPKKYQMMHKNN
jgi:signal transduction histidine kinase/ligand-binding sensor domain-containing protein/CheY-like chemotaxis protein